jgi:hypothetical protein
MVNLSAASLVRASRRDRKIGQGQLLLLSDAARHVMVGTTAAAAAEELKMRSHTCKWLASARLQDGAS